MKDKIYLEKDVNGWRFHKYTYSRYWYSGNCPHKHYISSYYRTREDARQAKRNGAIEWIRI